ncbi:major facilitator superfamily domain-containing protein [Xylogone sp. PMI_703]|nr:major facilitator superfamily domain-containing protein [Xylogone sp. PMI_703]
MSQTLEKATPRRLPSLKLVLDQARVTPEVLEFTYPGSGTQEDPYIISFIPHDGGNPYNWSSSLKWLVTVIVSGGTLATSFASTAFTGSLLELKSDLGASTELITAGISLFVLGFALGPLIWAPLSELYGRQIVFIVTFGAFTAFAAGCTGASNSGTLLVLRFFAGSFGSSTLTNSGGVIADIFPASSRGLALSLFVLMPSIGPTLGPICGGFLGEAQGWRWVTGLIAIFTGVMWILGIALVPETYSTVILRKRAAKLSQMTEKVYALKSDMERRKPSVWSVLRTSLFRPWVFLIREPIVLLLSLYMATIYGTLYLLFGAFPIVYGVNRKWSEGQTGLPFLGGVIGLLCALAFSFWSNKQYSKIVKSNGGVAPPEARLIPAMYTAIAIPIGLFWFAWTNQPSIHWLSSVAASIPFGFGLLVVFLSVTSYLIDSYLMFAASALAANTVLRSLFGAAFPLFTPDMYEALGIHWASSIPAFLALACVPFPFVFYKYGAWIRKRCAYASQADAVMSQNRMEAVRDVESPESTA